MKRGPERDATSAVPGREGLSVRLRTSGDRRLRDHVLSGIETIPSRRPQQRRKITGERPHTNRFDQGENRAWIALDGSRMSSARPCCSSP